MERNDFNSLKHPIKNAQSTVKTSIVTPSTASLHFCPHQKHTFSWRAGSQPSCRVMLP